MRVQLASERAREQEEASPRSASACPASESSASVREQVSVRLQASARGPVQEWMRASAPERRREAWWAVPGPGPEAWWAVRRQASVG